MASVEENLKLYIYINKTKSNKKIKKITKNSLLFSVICIEYNKEKCVAKDEFKNIQLKGVKK